MTSSSSGRRTVRVVFAHRAFDSSTNKSNALFYEADHQQAKQGVLETEDERPLASTWFACTAPLARSLRVLPAGALVTLEAVDGESGLSIFPQTLTWTGSIFGDQLDQCATRIEWAALDHIAEQQRRTHKERKKSARVADFGHVLDPLHSAYERMNRAQQALFLADVLRYVQNGS